MLEAKRADDFRPFYEFTVDGETVTTWKGRLWREGGTFDLEGCRYEIHGNLWRSGYEMTDQLGMVVAQAEPVGGGRWTVAANGRTYEFQRRTLMRRLRDVRTWLSQSESPPEPPGAAAGSDARSPMSGELLVQDGRPIGSIRQLGAFLDATADLPGMPLPAQVFAVVVMQSLWASERRSS